MATKRQRRTRSKRPPMPEWAELLRDHGIRPDPKSPAHDEMAAWLYFDEPIPGLPTDDTEKMRMVNNADEA